MLLRRLTQHVKSQNWFAVFLDFFIVIAGILIAFQITNWNEQRQERAEEQKVIERLLKDFVAIGHEADEKIEFLESVEDKFVEMQKFIVDFGKGIDPKPAHTFFETAFVLPSMVGQSATYSQLVSSGDMSLLSNDNLVAELVSHAALTQDLVHSDQSVRAFMRPYTVPLVRFSQLIESLPLEEAFSESGSRSEMIVTIDLYSTVLRGQLARFKDVKDSISKLTDILKSEQDEPQSALLSAE